MATVRLALVNDLVDPEAIDVWLDAVVGDAPVRFRLDTGAARCTVPLLDSTRTLMATGVDPAVGLSGSGLGDDEVVLPRLQVGGLVLEDVPATRLAAGSPLSPLLGMTALGRFLCDFEFSAAQLKLDDQTGAGRREWFALTSHVGARPMVPVEFDGRVAPAAWDTGAGLSAVDVAFARANPHLFEPLRAARGVDSSGVEMPSQLCRMAACHIAQVAIAPSACAIVDFGPLNATLEQPISFVLGMPAIIQADWTFDFPRRRWTVRRP